MALNFATLIGQIIGFLVICALIYLVVRIIRSLIQGSTGQPQRRTERESHQDSPPDRPN